MKTRIAALALAAAFAFVPSASADETTFCNAYITTLPYTISTQGHYCFNKNLSTAITTGNAITINVDYVVLDLNNFKLGGGGAGPTTEAIGVYAENHNNITVRNGNIRGFHTGIRVWDNGVTSQNVTIENNVLDGNTVNGIYTDLTNATIRNNQILATGGIGGASAWAINMGDSYFVVENNFIAGISATNTDVMDGGFGVFQGNTVAAYGSDTVYATICRDNNILSGTLACYRNSANLVN